MPQLDVFTHDLLVVTLFASQLTHVDEFGCRGASARTGWFQMESAANGLKPAGSGAAVAAAGALSAAMSAAAHASVRRPGWDSGMSRPSVARWGSESRGGGEPPPPGAASCGAGT